MDCKSNFGTVVFGPHVGKAGTMPGVAKPKAKHSPRRAADGKSHAGRKVMINMDALDIGSVIAHMLSWIGAENDCR
jgi:hypothetical protein